jgi:glycosyltransferase involved in cell wall biosynthesis
MKQKKILCWFDYVARTGFATVSKNIVTEIRKHYGNDFILEIVAINYFGEDFMEDEFTLVTSAKLNDGKKDDFGRNYFLKRLHDIDYDGVFVCQDLGVVVPIIEVMQFIKNEKRENNKKQFKSIFYFPVDCKLLPQITKDIEFFDTLVTYTEFARKEVYRLRPEIKGRVRVVNHGNNSKDFYPLSDEERIAFRKEYFGENADKFIITNVNRNQPRKDIPNTIFAYVEARKNWPSNLPEPFLYIHCHPNDPMGWDLRAILWQFEELEEDVHYKLLPKKYEQSMAGIDVLNSIYNASDVYLTTTLGEGWGLTFSEAAACKVPVIAPYTTSFMEMSGYGKNAYMLETIYPCCQFNDNVVREQTDIYEISDTLIQVARDKYSNAKDLRDKIERNYEWVRKLEWADVCKNWIEYFKIF